MHVIATTLLSLADGTHIAPGQLLELPDAAATILIAQGAALGPALVETAEQLTAAGLTADDLAAALPAPPEPEPAPRQRRRNDPLPAATP